MSANQAVVVIKALEEYRHRCSPNPLSDWRISWFSSRKQWVLWTNQFKVFPISYCPFCGKRLDDLEPQKSGTLFVLSGA